MVHVPMGHGLYNGACSHGSWIVQQYMFPWVMGCTTEHIPMGHGLYNDTYTHDSWAVQWYIPPWLMGCTTMHTNDAYPHDPWIVQQNIYPWVMDCTTIHVPMTHGLYNGACPHGSWVVQWNIPPWVMGCTTVHVPMTHGLYNGPLTQSQVTIWTETVCSHDSLVVQHIISSISHPHTLYNAVQATYISVTLENSVLAISAHLLHLSASLIA